MRLFRKLTDSETLLGNIVLVGLLLGALAIWGYALFGPG